MKGNRRNPPPPAVNAAGAGVPTASPPPPSAGSAKQNSKYMNKDGSKFITVSKPTDSQPQSPPPNAGTEPSATHHDTAGAAGTNGLPPTVNRKKAKRRAKAAAKAESGALANGKHNGVSAPTPPASDDRNSDQQQTLPAYEEAADSGDDGATNSFGPNASESNNNDAGSGAAKSKKAKKKKKNKGAAAATSVDDNNDVAATNTGPVASKEKIWNTTSQEERERIKEFWLNLSEDQRKSLVKVEKDTVLKKMKEQQKLTCSCHFCGRKRTAIEEELEGLYDSYYEELENFAHDPNGHQGRAPPLMTTHGHFAGSRVLHASAPASAYSGHLPSRGRIIEHVGEDDDDEGEDDFLDDDEDDLVAEDDDSDLDDEDIPPDDIHREYATDFFSFGNSLQVHGGILTVADDLLKNDGRKFIEMMEQLAERRMAREEDAKDHYSRTANFIQNGAAGNYAHTHHAPSDEEDYGPEDDDDEEEYDSQDDDYDEQDTMTEEERMEEGRRMFQIFAARMFEQRVLTAYREKVAKERQEKLLEELADEKTQESQRKAKKAKEAQKRKDKAAQKKQALAEEKARKDAEKAAEEARRREEEDKKNEEQRQKAEEKRKKREAERRAVEEEKRRKEAARIQRIQEQQDQERRAREAKERDKKLREEAQLKQKEAQEKKERETRERREKQERDKREKEARAQANEARERQKQEEKASQKGKVAVVPAVPAKPPVPAIPTASSASVAPAGPSQPITLARRPSQQPLMHQQQHQQQQPPPNTGAVPALPQQPPQPPNFASPQIAVATPALPKAPTPMRTRQLSLQGGGSAVGSQSGGPASRTASLSGSGQSQNASPNPMTPMLASPTSLGSGKTNAGGMSNVLPTPGSQGPSFGLGQAGSPLASMAKPAMQPHTSPFSIPHSSMGMPYPLGIAPVSMPPGLGLPSQFAPVNGVGFRANGAPPMMPMAPGINGGGRGFGPMVPPPPGFANHVPPEQFGGMGPMPPHMADNGGVPITHSRQPSSGFDPVSSPIPTAQPISRPAPIGRPGSIVHGQPSVSGSPGAGAGIDETESAHHLGSRALLDDSDFAPEEYPPRRPTGAPSRTAFGTPPGPFGGVDLTSPFVTQPSLWGGLPPTAPGSFGNGPPGFPNMGGWGGPVNPAPAPFPNMGGIGRPSLGRTVMLRQILCRACKDLAPQYEPGSFFPIEAVTARFHAIAPNLIAQGQESELDVLYDTEGNGNNGGGQFEAERAPDGSVTALRWTPDEMSLRLGSLGGDVLGPGDGNAAPIGTFSR